MLTVALIAFALAFPHTNTMPLNPHKLDAYDVIWKTPSLDAAGSMPIGNGEVVLNAWVEDKTGDLLFYIARSDALSEISRILKLGRIRVHMEPSPFKDARDFSQHLHLHDGRMDILGEGASMSLFVNSDSNVIALSGKMMAPTRVTATVECWRNAARRLPDAEKQSAWSVHDAPFPLVESADVFVPNEDDAITWYHRNETSVVPALWANQSLTGLKGTFDPLIHRTFGGRVSGAGLNRAGDHSLQSPGLVRTFKLSIQTCSLQTETVADWIAAVKQEAAASEEKTARWWHQYWDRSWVFAREHNKPSEAASDTLPMRPSITGAYILQRYVQACQGRSAYPIKFNGGSYTVEPTAMGRNFNADWRNWGDDHWFQNVRHMYHPMPAAGDFEMMEPFFRLYEAAKPLAESRTAEYHHAKGAYFPETMTVFGTYSGGDYGWDRTGKQPKDVDCKYWQYAWNQGPELVDLMLDYWDYTRDEKFLKQRLLPMARSVLTYFDTRFRKDAAGRIVLDPTQVVETYWYGVVNDMPTTSGLIAMTSRLCALPSKLLTASQRQFFAGMKAACPELPLETKDGKRELAPAQKYDPTTTNVENGQLYGVWPSRVVCLAHPALLDEAKTAYANRLNHLDTGWGYDGNVAALLGMTDEAARILRVKCANSNPKYRWPATWGPNYDWLPDQNHGGNLLETTNLMLLQSEPLEAGGAIRVLPAWPHTWDVEFKLHAPGNTVVHCVLKGGKIETLNVVPPSRKKDVILPVWAG